MLPLEKAGRRLGEVDCHFQFSSVDAVNASFWQGKFFGAISPTRSTDVNLVIGNEFNLDSFPKIKGSQQFFQWRPFPGFPCPGIREEVMVDR